MRVLVTGGTGIVGAAATSSLVRKGHEVRLLSRHADRDMAQWSHGVEAFPGDVAIRESISHAAQGCDAVLHIAGIIEEDPPARTYETVNIDGTRNVVAEAVQSGVRRFVDVSSLGAHRGTSEYHRSKFAAESFVSAFPREWCIVRLGNVYGPGDYVISVLLRTNRIFPVIPTVDGGLQPFQPIWYRDAGDALAAVVEGDGGTGTIIEVAGTEQTSMSDLLDRFSRLTGRTPARVSVPAPIADLGVRAAEAAGIYLPLNAAELTMLLEHNVVEDPAGNQLPGLLDRAPTTLDEGLLELVDAQPEQTPADGTGGLKQRRVWVDIDAPQCDLDTLFHRFRTGFPAFVPVQPAGEPGTDGVIDRGRTLTLALPLRGNVQVRTEQCEHHSITLATLAGHPLAGAVHFRFSPRSGGIRFEIEVFDRAATIFDRAAMRLGGDYAQRRTWIATADRILAESGGQSRKGVQHEAQWLDEDAAADIDAWLLRLIHRRKREQENP